MPLGKWKFNFDPLVSINRLIEEWSPLKYKTEKEYEDALYKYLLKNTKDIDISRQYGSGRVKVDICVDETVFIELKKDLNDTSKLTHLLGQIFLYSQEKFENLIIILTGRVDNNLEKPIKKILKDYFEDIGKNWAIVKK